MTPADVRLLTTVLTGGPRLRECYGMGADESFAALKDVDRFLRATSLTMPELRELLYQDLCPTAAGDGRPERHAASVFFISAAGVVTLDDEERCLQHGSERPVPVKWFELVNRFVRLARRTGLTFAELDLALRTCCGNRIDLAALRTLAVLVHLRRTLELPMDVVVSLVAPMNTLGFGTDPEPRDLFNRVFNAPFANLERRVITESEYAAPGYAGMEELTWSGDLLAPRNEAYRRRISAALSLSDGDLATIVARYRRGDRPGPFDAEQRLPALSLLHRISRLSAALGSPIAELFDVLDALDADPSIQRYAAFPLLIDPEVRVERTDAVLAGGDVQAALWLVQTLIGTVRWMRESGFSGPELLGVVGGPAGREREAADAGDGLTTVLDRLRQEFAAVELAPVDFASDRFGDRAAQVIHAVVAGDASGSVSSRDDRLVRVDRDRAETTAYAALAELPVITSEDFLDLGLDERHTAKLFAGLVRGGYLESDGTVVPDRLPAEPADLRLAGDFATHSGRVFALIAGFCAGPDGSPVPASFFHSDLAALDGLTDAERSELYDNLVFNGYLDPDGRVLSPDLFIEPDNAAAFTVNADLGDMVADVHARLRERVDRFGRDGVALDPDVFAGLGFGEPQLTALLDSLRFNGYLDSADRYIDPAAVLRLTVADFGLALEFYPYRRRVLDAIQAQLQRERAAVLRMSENDFRDIADAAVARLVVERLDGEFLVDGRVPTEQEGFFADLGNTLEIEGLTGAESTTVFDRIAGILAEGRPYRFDPGALGELGLDPGQQSQLIDHLVIAGHLTDTRTVPADRLDYFGAVHNALGFTLPGLADYSTDIFFLLHTVAAELRAGIAEITGLLSAVADRQHAVLYTVLQDALGVSAPVAEAICVAVAGSAADALDLLVAPALAGTAPAAAPGPASPGLTSEERARREGGAPQGPGPARAERAPAGSAPRLRRAFGRIRGFARLAAKLGLDADEVALAFRDQRLADKFPEELALPSGVDRIDALLESSDGRIYLFRGGDYWAYSASTYALLDRHPRALDQLSAHLADLDSVDAAFVDAAGTEWIVGRDKDGVKGLAFVREPGSTRWAPRKQEWGTAANNFADPARIDAAFVDEAGRTYLFAGDQYVRYSGTVYTHVDEGYPRRIGESRPGDGEDGATLYPDGPETLADQHAAELPAPFRRSLDAAFRGRDGRTYLFAGDRFVVLGGTAREDADHDTGNGAVDQPIGGAWGRVRNALVAAERVDAGYVAGDAQFLVAGDQVLRYTDGLENDDVCADPGYPRRIDAELGAGVHGPVPAEFSGGVEAAFVDPTGVLHLFKDGRTVAIGRSSPPGTVPSAVPTGVPTTVATAQKWGIVAPVLPGTVDAAFVGMDGRTYLFSGDRYLRYSTADYSVVDVGYPRATGDWGGLRRVDAAFVQDGATYLFGAAGLLFAVPADERGSDLDAGRLPRSLRQRLADHGIAVAQDAPVTGRSPQWKLTADHGIRLTLHHVDDRIEVRCHQATKARFHVRYSTRDYARPDAGYPRPLADNWWNLPEELVGANAAFARVDAVLRRHDRTYLFAGDQFAVYDNKRRWWSEPKSLSTDWDSLPFDRVDAAFVGADNRTYLFSGQRYVRYTDDTYARIDERYPAPITPFWGNVANTIARTGRVDAALVLPPAADAPADSPTLTYLFSGDQFVRYTGTTYRTVDDGYPKNLAMLAREPRMGNLATQLDRVDAAFADRRNVYLFSGGKYHVVSDAAYRRYGKLPGSKTDLNTVGCAYLEDGAVMVEHHPGGWRRYGALEGTAVRTERTRPRALRSVPAKFRSGLDAVLRGIDGNVYLFKGVSCFNTQLGREYPLAEEWGRQRNNLYHDNRVDAAFVGRDGRTYVFSGEQFLTYQGTEYLDAYVADEPRPVAAHWGGLRRVALAFVRGHTTYLFEPPEADGTMRYIAYSGDDYATPDDGYPATTDASFWKVPDAYRPVGFTAPDAVLREGTTTHLLIGSVCLQHDETTDRWSYPRPLERVWPKLGPTAGMTTAFTGRDGATYFFFAGEFARYHDGKMAAREPIRDRWGRSRNNLLAAGGTVDAAVVTGGVTYLFSGDQYVRYSGADYRYADVGYPKPIIGNLRREEAFANLPRAFDDELAERALAGARSLIDAAVANDRTSYLFAGGACHAVSRALTASRDVKALGRIRNTLAERQRVDAALVTADHTFLFSGDQYVRYSGADGYDGYVDDGYPRMIATSLPADLKVTKLPEVVHDGIDAAFRDAEGRTYLFAGKRCVRVEGGTVTDEPIAGVWGVVDSAFGVGAPVDAAFVAPTGELYAFAGDQYVRYRPGKLDVVEQGHPRRIKDSWGHLPRDFEDGIDGAFVLGGHTYLCRGEEYVRLPAERPEPLERAVRQPFRHGWSDAADYRLHDVRAVTRFAGLARSVGGGLAAFLLPGPTTFADPYEHLAGVFGWNVEELKWCRRHARFLSGAPADEDRFEIEFLLELVDLFAVTDRLGTGPTRLRADVWAPLYDAGAGLDAAGSALRGLLARRHGPAEWASLSRRLHDELNVRKRDALVGVVIAQDDRLRTSRDLFERLLIDVDMGGQGRTSRVREAIAATQLFIHRYLLNLEEDPTGATDPAVAEETRQRVKQWWTWMRNYRVWEANRKVFLYPENYLRPELRASKTPAFRALEADLLQGEITSESVERVYKRYLDEYTEVSRLTIAGGYVYTKDREPDGLRRLVLFGRTKTDPRRYYYRRAEFGIETLSARWEPWQPVDLRIDADQVHPVHAFGRVFVFWTTIEPVAVDDDPGSTTVEVEDTNGGQRVSGRGKTQQVKIYYSFYNLNGEWVPAQTLGAGRAEEGAISGVTLLVRPRMKDAGGERMSIVLSCSYRATVAGDDGKPVEHRRAALFDLNPELYADDLLDAENPASPPAEWVAVMTDFEASIAAAETAKRVADIFLDPVQAADVVRFDHPAGSEQLAWFSVDLRGGSFLCRPMEVAASKVKPIALSPNKDRLPEWERVDAAVELPNGTRYFFNNTTQTFLTAKPKLKPGNPERIGARWGRGPTVLPEPGPVDAVLTRGEHTYVFSKSRYVRFTGPPFGAIDAGYPKNIKDNDDKLPSWPRINAAFTGHDGVEYFFAGKKYTTSRDLKKSVPLKDHWSQQVEGFGPVEAALVTEGCTYVFSGRSYLRFPHGDPGTEYGEADTDEPLALATNTDHLPKDLRITAALWRPDRAYYFDNDGRYHEYVGRTRRSYPVSRPQSAVATRQAVDAAWVTGRYLYLTLGTEYVRYTLAADHSVPALVDDGYPRSLPRPVDAAFTRDGAVYLFSGRDYARLDAGMEPDAAATRPIAGAWGDLPRDGTPPFDAALDSDSGLYLFVDDSYVVHPKTDSVPRPYERTALPFELVRLTTGTASELNRRLLSGGVPALLDLSTQETDELALSTDPDAVGAVRVAAEMVAPGRLPAASHLDFRSANGLYYWEIFFHAPLLIAQALNGAQRFEDARRWYEYVFDPTNADSYWRFLPFLTMDLRALVETVSGDLAELSAAGLPAGRVLSALEEVLGALLTLDPVVAQNRRPATADERKALGIVASVSTQEKLAEALGALPAGQLTDAKRVAVDAIRERIGIIAGLGKQLEESGDWDALLRAYRDDPFDPHAIADLRPVAYRRAVVMSYIDNLLDWGDLLFRQYTPESVDEARMLYLLAYDLLGERDGRLGIRLPETAYSFAELAGMEGPLDLAGYLTAGGALVTDTGEIHASVANEYFHIPANGALDEYWNRVADRLRKIRQSLDIMGVSQPLPLFAPPVDPMALVHSAASGAGIDAVVAAPGVPVPAYRFTAVFRRAQELVDRLRQFGAELLDVLERRDAEELSMLRGRQEAAILSLTRDIRQAQVRIAEEHVAELTAGQAAARDRAGHYERLIAEGLSALEHAQLDRMASAAEAHLAAGVLKVVAGIASAAPQIKTGPFIIGLEIGGDQFGDSIDKAAEVAESFGEAYSVQGELLGLRAEHQRTKADWDLQLRTARSDLAQIEHQLTGATHQLAIARREADLLDLQITHDEAVAEFLRSKFGTAELYGWMSGQLSALYFQSYHLAYEMAKAAERAYQFERGVSEAEAGYIRPTYWESRRGGLLAGQSLAVDLERLGNAYLGGEARDLEITKQVSLLDVDPLALLRLRDGGRCEFALTEAQFDRDFPGHFRRQLRTITVTFVDADGQPLWVNATLTQLSHKTLLEPDARAVQHLLDPKGPAPETVRSDWRPSQRIALSEVDGENNGMFELRYDDDRYLPFERTGAVSTWRLERSGRPMAQPYDVILTVRYTARYGGDPFANAVRGMLKPYPAARFFDVAREFPEQWEAFLGDEAGRLVLPLIPELFPGMASRQISAIHAAYETADRATRLVLNGTQNVPLDGGTTTATPGLSIGGDAASGLTFVLDGDRQALYNVGLVLSYQAAL
jgi:hypothetical protein